MKVGDVVELSARGKRMKFFEDLHNHVGIIIKKYCKGNFDFEVKWTPFYKYSPNSALYRYELKYFVKPSEIE